MKPITLEDISALNPRAEALVVESESLPGGADFLRLAGHRPELIQPFVELFAVLTRPGAIGRRTKELLAVKIRQLEDKSWEADYYPRAEENHESVLSESPRRLNGIGAVSHPERGALADFQSSDYFTDAEKAALLYVEYFVMDGAIFPEELIEELKSHYGDEGCVELVLFVGYHVALGRVAQAWRLSPNPFWSYADWSGVQRAGAGSAHESV